MVFDRSVWFGPKKNIPGPPSLLVGSFLLATTYFKTKRGGGALAKVVFDKQQERYLVANEKDYISTHNHPSADDPEQEEEDGDDDVNAEDDNDSDDSDTDTNNKPMLRN